MAMSRKAVVLVLFGAVVDGHRAGPKKGQAISKDHGLLQSGYVADHLLRVSKNQQIGEGEQMIAQDPEIDPSEDQGSNEALQIEAEREINEEKEMGSLEELSPDSLPHCHLSQSDCKLEDMNGATLVYTDSDNSRCISGEPFAFLVKPGRSDKLLFFFGPGGACWESPLLKDGVMMCRSTLAQGLTNTGLGSGFTEPRTGNNFLDFTFVSPPYCDGSAQMGNTTLGGAPQYGYTNSLFALEWAKRNLEQPLANFVIGGSSAGALGVMGWSHYMLSTFQYNKATVIVDSYMAVFPDGTQGRTVKQFGACDLPMWAHFRETCEAEAGSLQDMLDYAIAAHPSVAFAVIQPKWDIMQRLFFSAIAASNFKIDVYISTVEFYRRCNDVMRRYNRHRNFVHYYVGGGWHTFLYWRFYWSATVKGSFFTRLKGDGGKPTLAEWTNALIEHEPVQSVCGGDLQKNGGSRWLLKNTRYCDESLHPKTLSFTSSSLPQPSTTP